MGSIEQQILQCLIVDGRLALRRIAEVVGVSEQTVARRYRAMRDEGQLRVFVVRSGFSPARRAWTMRIRCRPDSAVPLAEALADRDDTAWIALVSGGSEIICTTTGPFDSSTDGVLRRLPNTSAVLSFSANSLLRAFAGAANEWSVFDTPLTAQQVARLSPRARLTTKDVEVTDEDAPLLEALGRDGRATAATLAREIGWPASRVSTRIDALVVSGALYVSTDYLPEAFGYHACAVMHLTVRPGDITDVCQALVTHRPTGFVAATTGVSNVMATVVCRTSDDLFSYVTEQVGKLPGVNQLELVPYLERVKEGGSRVVHGRLVPPR